MKTDDGMYDIGGPNIGYKRNSIYMYRCKRGRQQVSQKGINYLRLKNSKVVELLKKARSE